MSTPDPTPPDATATPRTDAAFWRQAHDRQVEIRDNTTRLLEKAEAALRERTQWQCACGGTDCAGQAENERLKQICVEDGELIVSHGHTIDQLRARVAAMEAQLTSLEADKARLVAWIKDRLYEWNKNGRGMCAFGRERMEQLEAALDAARAGKGAT